MKVNLRLLTIGLSLSIFLSACSTVGDWFADESYEEPPEPLTEFTSEISPKILWDKGVGDGAGDRKLELSSWWQNNKIFAVDHEGSCAFAPTFVDVGASRFFTNCRQVHGMQG